MKLVNIRLNNGSVIKEARLGLRGGVGAYMLIPMDTEQEINNILTTDVFTGFGNGVEYSSETCAGFIFRDKIESYEIIEK